MGSTCFPPLVRGAVACCRSQPLGLRGRVQAILRAPSPRPLWVGCVVPRALQVPKARTGCGAPGWCQGETWEVAERGEQDCAWGTTEFALLSLCARAMSIGVTTGTMFCGLCGHPERAEHTGTAP